MRSGTAYQGPETNLLSLNLSPSRSLTRKTIITNSSFRYFFVFSPYCCKLYGAAAAAANTLVNTFGGICFSFNNNY